MNQRETQPAIEEWTPGPGRSSSWADLERHAARLGAIHLRRLFDDDPERGRRLRATAVGMTLDFSKNHLDDSALASLLDLAAESRVQERVQMMSRGDKINASENRSVLHMALRLPEGSKLEIEGTDVVAEVHRVLARMEHLANQVRRGERKGATGEPITNVVNIGIGGSHLGPAMAYRALLPYVDRDLSFAFVSNVDPSAMEDTLRDLDPAATLFIVASKTFTTAETMSNARSARDWVASRVGAESAGMHFVAVSAAPDRAAEFGVGPRDRFEMWDWVGGRYSMDSAIGLSTMIAIGPDRFRDMLRGFHDMDLHFLTAEPQTNLPLIHGMLSVWYRNFFGYATHGVMPYDSHLDRFPDYLQQLTMESNGKSVTLSGKEVEWDTGPIYWGSPGTDGQHSFFQLLHQGTTVVPLDLIGFARSHSHDNQRHSMLLANMLAQSRALAFGRTAAEVTGGSPTTRTHRVMPGNRPSNTIVAEKLDPYRLGTLVALYEHSVFTQGVVWGINSFDQWGVELGKKLATQIEPYLSQGAPSPAFDSSTNGLIEELTSGIDHEEDQ